MSSVDIQQDPLGVFVTNGRTSTIRHSTVGGSQHWGMGFRTPSCVFIMYHPPAAHLLVSDAFFKSEADMLAAGQHTALATCDV